MQLIFVGLFSSIGICDKIKKIRALLCRDATNIPVGEKSMSIYEPEDYKEVINRIRNKLDENNIKMGECVSEEAIAAFENRCKIRLPEAYRLFLKNVGNGCDSMIDGCCLKQLEDIEQKDLSRPFMLEEFWLWEEDDREEDIINEEMETKVYQGEIELINLGCGMSYNLIVSGKCRGEVWNFTDVGVQPCCERQDFLGWFELWLDCQDETDYFKDYV